MQHKALLKRLSGDSLIYGLSSVLIKFISFFLFPFFARELNPADYGLINIFNTLTFFTAAVISLGLDAAVTRWFYDENTEDYKNKIFSNWWFAHLGAAIVAIIILQLVGKTVNAVKAKAVSIRHFIKME